MKTQLVVSFVFLVFIFNLRAQSSSHPTVSSVKVTYRSVHQSTTNAHRKLQGVPVGIIQLNNSISASKIHFKIQGVSASTLYYEVSYNLDSEAVFAPSGNKLFENTSGGIFISTGEPFTIKPYTIKVQTEDSQHNLSPVFTIIQ